MSAPNSPPSNEADHAQLYAYAQDLRRLLNERDAARRQLDAYVGDLKMLLRERDSARDAADTARQAKERFLACVGDELRAPLTTIVGFSELLLREDCPPDIADGLQRILSAGQLLAARIDNLLLMANLHRGTLAAQASPVNLVELLTTLHAEYDQRGASRNLRCTLELPAAPVADVMLDRGKVELALRALLDNALKFAPDGTFRLRLGSTNEHGRWVEVEDDGPGLEAGVAAQLFSPFNLGDPSPARAYTGVGLGLAMAAALLEQCGGQLQHFPRDARGAHRFRVRLPASM